MTISQLSVKTGLSRAAVRRCLYTLSKLGFAGADDGQRYALRPRMLSLSHTYTTSSNALDRRPAHPRAHEPDLPRVLLGRHARWHTRSSTSPAPSSRPASWRSISTSARACLPTAPPWAAFCWPTCRADQLESLPRQGRPHPPHHPHHRHQRRQAARHAPHRPPPWLRAGRSGARSRPPLARRAGLRPLPAASSPPSISPATPPACRSSICKASSSLPSAPPPPSSAPPSARPLVIHFRGHTVNHGVTFSSSAIHHPSSRIQ